MPSESRSGWLPAIITGVIVAILAVLLSLGISAGTDTRGPLGVTGATGPSGQNGATGSAGPEGPAGENGAMGATGAAGPQGSKGPVGQTGPLGPAGDDGAPGTPGAPGAPGTPGAQGVPGAPGTPGAPGANAVVTYAEADKIIGVYLADEIFNTGNYDYSSTAALSLSSGVDQGVYVLQFSTQAITHDVGMAHAWFEVQCSLTGPAVMSTGGTNQFLVLSSNTPRSFTNGKATDSLATFAPTSVTRVIRVNGTSGNVGVSCAVNHVNSSLPYTDPSLTLDKPTLVLYRT